MCNIKLEGSFDMLEGSAAFQRDLNKLDHRADWYRQEFSRCSEPMQKHGLGKTEERKQLWRKKPGVDLNG